MLRNNKMFFVSIYVLVIHEFTSSQITLNISVHAYFLNALHIIFILTKISH